MVDIQPAADEIRRGKKRKIKEEDRKGQKYNGSLLHRAAITNERRRRAVSLRRLSCLFVNGPTVDKWCSIVGRMQSASEAGNQSSSVIEAQRRSINPAAARRGISSATLRRTHACISPADDRNTSN